jgi:glycosyltransferase involved in cell wall biosynthesis
VQKTQQKRALFLQSTDPATYPPILHSQALLLERGWQVWNLSLPIAGEQKKITPHPNLQVIELPARATHVVSAKLWITYAWHALKLAFKVKPHLVYGSDSLVALAQLLSATHAKRLYHEHDSPEIGDMRAVLRWLRGRMLSVQDWIVYPNTERADVMQQQQYFDKQLLRIVWNLPRRNEVVLTKLAPSVPLKLYYHGNISPVLLPETVLQAVIRLKGRVQLQVLGYEVNAQTAYLNRLKALSAASPDCFVYLGQRSRSELIAAASDADVGFAAFPMETENINLRHLIGASNKVFDYMAAGLVVLVNQNKDWHEQFVMPGHALAVDPSNVDSIEAVLIQLLESPELLQQISARNRAQITFHWNSENHMGRLIEEIEQSLNS